MPEFLIIALKGKTGINSIILINDYFRVLASLLLLFIARYNKKGYKIKPKGYIRYLVSYIISNIYYI